MMKRCIVIGSMPIGFDLKSIITPDDFIYCADGGYIHAANGGITPDIIVGDFDSSPQPEDPKAKIIKLPCEKDDTDTYHIARMAVEEKFTDAVFCGVTGGRLDHTIANIQMLKYLENSGVNAVILDKDSEIRVITDRSITLQPRENCYFSVFSMDEKCLGVSETGGKYQIDDVQLTNTYPVGVSNEFCGKPIEITVKQGSLLIIVTKKD